MRQSYEEVVAITVRTSSTRLPGKCHLPIGEIAGQNISILEHILDRCRESFQRVVVCTSTEFSDNQIEKVSYARGVEVYRGSISNKAKRYFDFMSDFGIQVAHFLDADDPFFSIDEIRESIRCCISTSKSILPSPKSESGNASVGSTLTLDILARCLSKVPPNSNFEMVNSYIEFTFPELSEKLKSQDPLPEGTRLTVDYFNDYLFACLLWRECHNDYSRERIRDVLESNPALLEINRESNGLWKQRQALIIEKEKML